MSEAVSQDEISLPAPLQTGNAKTAERES